MLAGLMCVCVHALVQLNELALVETPKVLVDEHFKAYAKVRQFP